MKCQAVADFSLWSVPWVADHRVSDGREMHANLMLAAGQKINFQ